MGACESTPSTQSDQPRARPRRHCCPAGDDHVASPGSEVPKVTSPEYSWIYTEMLKVRFKGKAPLIELKVGTANPDPERKHHDPAYPKEIPYVLGWRRQDFQTLEQLLPWDVVGYSIGRKMTDGGRDKYLKNLKEKLHANAEGQKQNLRNLDRRAHKNIFQTWFIYVKIRQPGTETFKFIKLYSVDSREDYSADPKGVEQCMDILKAQGPESEDRYKFLYKEWEEYKVGNSSVSVEIYDSFDYELKDRDGEPENGCRIIDLPDDEKESTVTLYDLLELARFKEYKFPPVYVNPEVIGDGKLPVNNCITYVMRVMNRLGAEINPAGWSFLNKKRGRVFEVSDLKHGSCVRLDGKGETVFRIHYPDNTTISAVELNPEIPEDDTQEAPARIPLTIFEHNGHSYVKEVWKICDKKGSSLKHDIGPRKKGYQRLTFWGEIQNGSHLFSPFGDRISVRGKLHDPDNDVTPHGNWTRITHKDFDGDKIVTWMNKRILQLTDDEYKRLSETGRESQDKLLKMTYERRRRLHA